MVFFLPSFGPGTYYIYDAGEVSELFGGSMPLLSSLRKNKITHLTNVPWPKPAYGLIRGEMVT